MEIEFPLQNPQKSKKEQQIINKIVTAINNTNSEKQQIPQQIPENEANI